MSSSWRSTVLCFAAFLLFTISYQIVALGLAFSDFHPGGDVPLDAGDARRAKAGVAMLSPFTKPVEMMRDLTVRVTGGYDFISSSTFSKITSVTFWVFLPVVYSLVLQLIFRRLRRWLSRKR